MGLREEQRGQMKELVNLKVKKQKFPNLNNKEKQTEKKSHRDLRDYNKGSIIVMKMPVEILDGVVLQVIFDPPNMHKTNSLSRMCGCMIVALIQ